MSFIVFLLWVYVCILFVNIHYIHRLYVCITFSIWIFIDRNHHRISLLSTTSFFLIYILVYLLVFQQVPTLCFFLIMSYIFTLWWNKTFYMMYVHFRKFKMIVCKMKKSLLLMTISVVVRLNPLFSFLFSILL